jgi:LysM repeat protein
MYKIPIDSIYKYNPGSKEGIREGSTLNVPQLSGSFHYHTIQPKETLYSVSRMYQMTGEDIVAVNPGLSVQTFTIGKTIRIPVNEVTEPMPVGNEYVQKHDTEALLFRQPMGGRMEVVRVALLLPFGLNEDTNETNASTNRFVEYYEGFLMALERLKNEGVSVDLSVHDIGKSEKELPAILQKLSLSGVDLLIGGYTDKQIKLISQFSKEKSVPYVIPFTSKSDEPMNNPHAFQINTPQSYLYSKASAVFCNAFKGDNIIIYLTNATDDKAEFVKLLETDLKKNNESVTVVKAAETVAKDVQTLLSAQRLNVIVPSDDSKESLVKLIASLKIFYDTHPEYPVSLFGYPGWQAYAGDYMEDYFKLYLHFYSLFYVDPTVREMKDFQYQFSRWYSRGLIETYPKFGVLGYDTGMFFIKGLNEYGAAFEANIKKVKYKGIQTDFQFERVNNWGGFINTNIYLVTFNPDFTVNKDLYR